MSDSNDRLQVIQKRLDAAPTEGWKADHEYPMFVGKRHAVVIPRGPDLVVGYKHPEWSSDAGGPREQMDIAITELIANAPDDLKWLASEVQRLRQLVDKNDDV